MERNRWMAAVVSAVTGFAGAAGGAWAQALDVIQPEVARGEAELREVNLLAGRYANGSSGVARSTHETSFAFSPNDWINVTFHLELDDVRFDGWRTDHVGMETVVPLLRATEAAGGLAVSWYTTLQASTDHLSTNSLVFGPVAKLSTPGGRGWVTVNPFIEDQFGRNAGPGVNLLYGWQARWKLDDTWALGVDGFGKITDLAHADAEGAQDHRLGPAIYTELRLGPENRITIDAALLFGLAQASPDRSLKLNVGRPF